MSRPFHPLTLAQFVELLGTFPFSRVIDADHLRHTWQPDHSEYRGLSMNEGKDFWQMRDGAKAPVPNAFKLLHRDHHARAGEKAHPASAKTLSAMGSNRLAADPLQPPATP